MARVKNIDSNKYGQEWGATGIAPAVQTTATILENSLVVSYKATRTYAQTLIPFYLYYLLAMLFVVVVRSCPKVYYTNF